VDCYCKLAPAAEETSILLN